MHGHTLFILNQNGYVNHGHNCQIVLKYAKSSHCQTTRPVQTHVGLVTYLCSWGLQVPSGFPHFLCFTTVGQIASLSKPSLPLNRLPLLQLLALPENGNLHRDGIISQHLTCATRCRSHPWSLLDSRKLKYAQPCRESGNGWVHTRRNSNIYGVPFQLNRETIENLGLNLQWLIWYQLKTNSKWHAWRQSQCGWDIDWFYRINTIWCRSPAHLSLVAAVIDVGSLQVRVELRQEVLILERPQPESINNSSKQNVSR